MKKRHPHIPAIVLTSCSSSVLEEKIEAFGNYKFFEKPMDMNVLVELIFQELESGDRSQIHGISISAFLQLVDMEKKTCTLTVKSQDKVGYLYLSGGELVAAETGDLKGEEAAHNIICWEKTIIEIENVCRKKEKEITLPLMMVLMESARKKDEVTPAVA
jgi:hypothetical protein